MKDFYAALQRLTDEGHPFVLCTVIASNGSTPQKVGSKLVVKADGTLLGTIGGGAIEQQAVDAARELLSSSALTRTLETHLTHDLGMCCGGRMTVFLEKHLVAPSLTIFGAGHVAKELAALASTVGFTVTVVDEREGWASVERFPSARLLLQPCEDAARALTGGLDAFVCIATHDHPLDQACLEALLDKPLAYLGVIGSRRKAERFRARLLAAGFPDAVVQRFECPMGLEVGAVTPQEIAVSIVARLVGVRRAARVEAKVRRLTPVSG
jgi:xanthine dehydrogenase accessory factor